MIMEFMWMVSYLFMANLGKMRHLEYDESCFVIFCQTTQVLIHSADISLNASQSEWVLQTNDELPVTSIFQITHFQSRCCM